MRASGSSARGFQVILAEAIGWLLGGRIGVPIPDAAVYSKSMERSWLSRAVESPAPTHFNPGFALRISNLGDLGAMMALDVLILDEDRHRQNILLQPEPDELHLKVWAIDSGNAKIGWIDDFVERRRDLPSPHNLARGLPLDLLTDGAITAAEAAAGIESAELRSFVQEACEIVGEARVDVLHEVLAERCADAPDLVSRYLPLTRLSP